MLTSFALSFTSRTALDLIASLRLDAGDDRQGIRRLSDLFKRMAGGWEAATVISSIGTVKATATLTFTDDPADNGTFVLCGKTFTAQSSGAIADEWNITSGGSSAADAAANAASVAALVNLNATASKCVVATSALGVVTFTAVDGGEAANGFVLTESLSNTTRVDFAGGSNGTQVTLALL